VSCVDRPQLFPPLVFSQSTLEEALASVYKEAGWDIGGEAIIEDWVRTMGRRIRVICRHVRQAEVKSPRLPWLRLLGFTPPPPLPLADVDQATERFDVEARLLNVCLLEEPNAQRVGAYTDRETNAQECIPYQEMNGPYIARCTDCATNLATLWGPCRCPKEA